MLQTKHLWIWRRRFFEGLLQQRHDGHFGHTTWTIGINFQSPRSMKSPYEIWFHLKQLLCSIYSMKYAYLSDVWTKVKKWPWPWALLYFHVIIKFNIHTTLHASDFNGCWLFYHFPIQKHKEPKLTFCKISQGPPKVIIWTNFVGPKSPMLQTKPRPLGLWFWRKRILKGFYHIQA